MLHPEVSCIAKAAIPHKRMDGRMNERDGGKDGWREKMDGWLEGGMEETFHMRNLPSDPPGWSEIRDGSKNGHNSLGPWGS